MQLETLKIFCDVVRTASFSRGAAENSISQSSASQAVHQLELRLGVKLIDRSKRPLLLTPHGKVFYDGCKDLVDRYLDLENRVRSLEDPDTVVGTVGVAAIYSVGLPHMRRFVDTFEARYPDASVRVEYLHPDRVLERVLEGKAELGLLSFPKKWPELTVITWREEPMVLAVPPTHRFALRSSVMVAELDGEPFVGFDSDLSIRRAIERFLRRHGVSVEAACAFDNIENIKRAVEAGSGVSILPEPTLAQEVKSATLCAIPLESAVAGGPLVRALAIIHRRHARLEPAARKFLELLTADGPPNGQASSQEQKRAAASASP
jgi:DNA-binding transcriptional LysR family regulator